MRPQNKLCSLPYFNAIAAKKFKLKLLSTAYKMLWQRQYIRSQSCKNHSPHSIQPNIDNGKREKAH